MQDGFEAFETGFEGLSFRMGRSQWENRVGNKFGKHRMDLRGWIPGWGDPCGKRVQKNGLGRGSCGRDHMGWGFLRNSSGWACLTPVQTLAPLWV